MHTVSIVFEGIKVSWKKVDMRRKVLRLHHDRKYLDITKAGLSDAALMAAVT